ncbi:MAG TPA: polysaccharide biosynthesis tyrosine autokinase [Anaerolineales bacterium]|nr:polysaccharide biosynthesis tyrosine autokinase [Anaerolineales bacterium]
MNDFMELHRVITIAMRRWWLLVVLTIVGAVMGYLVSRIQTPVYQATTTVLVGESIRSSSVDRVDIQISEALIQTYVEIARRQPVLEGVVSALNLNESWQSLERRVTVNPIESTQLIEITVEANSPELARTIADEVVNQLILLSPSGSESVETQLSSGFNQAQIANLQQRITNGQNRLAEIEAAIENTTSETQLTALQQEKTQLEGFLIEWERNYTQLVSLAGSRGNPTQLTVVEPAHSSGRMIRPRVQLNTLLGAGLGLVLALGLVFLLEFLDDTYRSLKDFSQSEEVHILGSVRKIRGKKLSDKLIAYHQPHSPIAESFRIIRSRIRFKGGDGLAKTIMVTSSMPEEGKSLTVANLAVVFAQANYKTIIVDANMRHPVLHDVFAVNNETGLGDVLNSHELQVAECIKDTSVTNLQILTSGTALPDASGQLGSERMEKILMDLKKTAEIVIFDSPPVLVFADAIVLSRRVDGVIVVIQAGKSKRAEINQTLLDLQNANAEVLGSVLNQAPKSDSFSVNKVYMQERPRLPFARALTRKENQLRDLGNLAVPLNRSAVSPETDGENANTTTPISEGLEEAASTNGFKGSQLDTLEDTTETTDHHETTRPGAD